MKANIHGEKVDIIHKDVQIVTMQPGQNSKLNLDTFSHYHKPLVTQIDDDTVEKYTDRGSTFDYESYIKFQNQEEGKFLVKIKECNEITERGDSSLKQILQIRLERIEGDNFSEYCNKLEGNQNLSLDDCIKIKLSYFYQILDWFRVMLKFSQENHPTCIFCHEDIHAENIILAKGGKLILLDPDSFRWVEPSEFFMQIIKILTQFLIDGLYSSGFSITEARKLAKMATTSIRG